MSEEPVLRADDVACWGTWQRTFALHQRTLEFRRHVDAARRVIDQEVSSSRNGMVAWSAGKDSTAMTHLIVVDRGHRDIAVVSEKDDLDYPGEEDYVTELAAAWGARLQVVKPELSPLEFVERRAHAMTFGRDIHGRTAELSKKCFYNVMAEANAGRDLVALGLRAQESGRRARLRNALGLSYTLVDGSRRIIPIADWTGLDVFSYLQMVGIEPLPVYRCVAMTHRHAPWEIRKSWWLPGVSANHGTVAWLRRYWPNLFDRLRRMFPVAQAYA